MSALASLWHKIRQGLDPKGGHEGSSRVGKNQAVWGHFYRQDKGDFYLGRAYMKDRKATLGFAKKIGHRSKQHLMVIGGTRAGKGRRILMHNILDHPGNSFVIDPKGESAIVCAHALEQRGYRVVLLDPFDQCQNVVGDGSMARFKVGYNPLFDINPMQPGADILLQAISTVLIKDEGTSGDAGVYWRDAQRNVVQGLMAWSLVVFREEQEHLIRSKAPNLLTPMEKYFICDEQNLRLTSQFNEKDDDFLMRLVSQMCEYSQDQGPSGYIDDINHHVGGLIRNGGRTAEKLINRQGDPLAFRSLLTTLGNNFMWAKSVGMQTSLAAPDMSFTMSQLKTDEKLAVFAVVPKAFMQVAAPWLRMLVCMGMNACELNPKQPRHPINFIIDEAPRLGHIPEVEAAFAMGAGQGIRVVYVCQDLGQVRKDYGDSWETFIGNSSQMVLSVGDNFTTQYFSQKADKTYSLDQKTKQKGDKKVEVMTPGEIAKITHPERYVGLYFEGGADPLRVKLTNYDAEKRAGRDYRVHPDHARRSDRLPKAGVGQALAIESKNEGVVMLEDRRPKKVRMVKPAKVKKRGAA